MNKQIARTTKKARAINIPPAVLAFLDIITTMPTPDHNATHADFIKKAVLDDIREKIKIVDERGTY